MITCDGCGKEGKRLDLHFPGGESAYLCSRCRNLTRCDRCRKLVRSRVLQAGSTEKLCCACNRKVR